MSDKSALGGALLGALAKIFVGPVVGMAAGGTALGAVDRKLRDKGVNDKLMKLAGEQLDSGHAASSCWPTTQSPTRSKARSGPCRTSSSTTASSKSVTSRRTPRRKSGKRSSNTRPEPRWNTRHPAPRPTGNPAAIAYGLSLITDRLRGCLHGAHRRGLPRCERELPLIRGRRQMIPKPLRYLRERKRHEITTSSHCCYTWQPYGSSRGLCQQQLTGGHTGHEWGHLVAQVSPAKNFQVSTPTGQLSLSLDGKLPPDWPSQFPVPSGAIVAGSWALRVVRIPRTLVAAYTTAGPPSGALAFYKGNSKLTTSGEKSVSSGSATSGRSRSPRLTRALNHRRRRATAPPTLSSH